jgi:hypothetical protein
MSLALRSAINHHWVPRDDTHTEDGAKVAISIIGLEALLFLLVLAVGGALVSESS